MDKVVDEVNNAEEVANDAGTADDGPQNDESLDLDLDFSQMKKKKKNKKKDLDEIISEKPEDEDRGEEAENGM